MDTDFSGAKNAIELCSCLKQWDMYCRTAEAESLVSLKERLRQSCTEAMESCADPERKEVMRVALLEWDHPDFILWLKAKVSGYFG